MMSKSSAIFLDRDGVIIENRARYVRCWDDVSFLPGALDALLKLSASSFSIVIVTNQSAVGRGIIELQVANAINARIVTTIQRHGGRIDAVEMCPHAPEDKCSCRKPEPGLLLRAQRRLNLDMGVSVLIGDSISDLLAGQAAGIGNLHLVRTGLGAAQEPTLATMKSLECRVHDNLGAAISRLFPML